MADALDKLRAGTDKARRKLAAQRLGGREYPVTVETYTAGDKITGRGGTWSAPLTLDPRPVVELKAIMRNVEDGLQQVGDARVRGISRTYTEAQLRGADSTRPSRWTVNGRLYSLVDLQAKPLEWVVILKGYQP